MRSILVLTTSMFIPFAAHADIGNANNMCNWLDSLKLLAGPCQISQKSTAVVTKIVTSKSEARKICKTISGTMKKDGVKFDKGWILQISNPEKPNVKAVQCKL